MMELDEAIKHCLEVAEQAEKNCISCDTFHWRYTDEAEKLLNDEK